MLYLCIDECYCGCMNQKEFLLTFYSSMPKIVCFADCSLIEMLVVFQALFDACKTIVGVTNSGIHV